MARGIRPLNMEGRVKFTVKNAGAVRLNLFRVGEDIRREAIVFMRKKMLELKQEVSDGVPYDLGFMSENVDARQSKGGFAFEVGWRAEDFVRSESGQFYPPHVELGTRLMPARPTLGPMFEQKRFEITAGIALIMRRATKARSAK